MNEKLCPECKHEVWRHDCEGYEEGECVDCGAFCRDEYGTEIGSQ